MNDDDIERLRAMTPAKCVCGQPPRAWHCKVDPPGVLSCCCDNSDCLESECMALTIDAWNSRQARLQTERWSLLRRGYKAGWGRGRAASPFDHWVTGFEEWWANERDGSEDENK